MLARVGELIVLQESTFFLRDEAGIYRITDIAISRDYPFGILNWVGNCSLPFCTYTLMDVLPKVKPALKHDAVKGRTRHDDLVVFADIILESDGNILVNKGAAANSSVCYGN